MIVFIQKIWSWLRDSDNRGALQIIGGVIAFIFGVYVLIFNKENINTPPIPPKSDKAISTLRKPEINEKQQTAEKLTPKYTARKRLPQDSPASNPPLDTKTDTASLPEPSSTINQTMTNSPGGVQVGRDLNINEPAIPEWSIGTSEKVNNGEFRTKLSARGKGRLAYYNWNILLTLNTEVTRREDVHGEVTVGPWMPLSTKGGNLLPNQFFIGFSEFKPGQAVSIYLYSREPLNLMRFDTLSD